MDTPLTSFAPLIREIGRGRDGARSLDYDTALALWRAVLAGTISDLELGAVLLALRVKGESAEELAAFCAASRETMLRLAPPTSGERPVVIPSYNGARKLPNLTALLALLLTQRGIPVLVHGVVQDGAGRVTTADVFRVLGLTIARDADDAEVHLARHEPVFMPLAVLNPALDRVLGLRRILGVRNSGHTISKLLQPFTGGALRLANFTHPDYEHLLDSYLRRDATRAEGGVVLMRGTEGEAVANARRSARIDFYLDGTVRTLVPAAEGITTELPLLPESKDATVTACWIQAVVGGERPVPAPIAAQLEAILEARRMAG